MRSRASSSSSQRSVWMLNIRVREALLASVTCAVPPESFQARIYAWATLHGITSLDAYGQFDWMTPEARDALFASTIRVAALAAGIPVEHPPA